MQKNSKIQNYVFKLTNRATVDEMALTVATVANISNEGSQLFISTDHRNEEEEEGDEGEVDKDEEIVGEDGKNDDQKSNKTV